MIFVKAIILTTTVAWLLFAVLFLAYSNGANDNFKGVATLFGSGTTNYRKALAWATITTLAGSLLALALAHGLVDTFKGKGLVPDAVTLQPAFLLAVSLGAALTVIWATWTGLPVSTTHALTGALLGAGLAAAPGEVRLASLGTTFVLPLLFSPLVASLLTVMLYPCFRFARLRTGVVTQAGQLSEGVERYQGTMLGMQAAPVLDALHYLSGGAVGFARGLNDTPKMVALLLAGEAVRPNLGLALVAVAIGVGGLLNAGRVADTLSRKITRMNPGQGFTANLVTAVLVTEASRFGLPVSTTHVACGSLFGIGVVNGTGRWKMILTILLAWVTTLPVGATLAAILYLVLWASQVGV